MQSKVDQKAIIAVAVIIGFIAGVIFTNTTSKNGLKVSKNMTKSVAAVQQQAQPQTVNEPDMSKLLLEFKQNSLAWRDIDDWSTKQKIVETFIDIYKDQGVEIKKSPMHYFVLIESLTNQNPSMLKQPFDIVLRIVAIMEYDFDNGEDKDKLAREILGDREFVENKARLGIK